MMDNNEQLTRCRTTWQPMPIPYKPTILKGEGTRQRRAARSSPSGTVTYTSPLTRSPTIPKKRGARRRRAARSSPSGTATYACPYKPTILKTRGYQTTMSSSLIAIWHGDLRQPSRSPTIPKKGGPTTTSYTRRRQSPPEAHSAQ